MFGEACHRRVIVLPRGRLNDVMYKRLHVQWEDVSTSLSSERGEGSV